MIDHALPYVDRVVFIVSENNLRSQKALEKIDAKFLKEIERPSSDGVIRRNVMFVVE